VQMAPSMMKMRSSSTRIAGWRACITRAKNQCVVARRPFSKPASASTKLPVHRPAMRRAWRSERRRNFRTPSDAGRRLDFAARLAVAAQLVEGLAGNKVGELEHRLRGQRHQLEAVAQHIA